MSKSTSSAPSLAGKVALITGGSTGIGLAAALLFQREGAHVIITGQNADNLAAARAALGEQALVLKADSRIVADHARVADEIRTRFGGLDVAFLNAGVARFAPIEAGDEAFYEDMMATNVKGVVFGVQALSPLLRAGASVIVTTSVVDSKGVPNAAIYSATKGAVAALVRSLAVELAPRGIRVNSLSPGPIDTPIYGKLGLPADAVAGFQASMTAQVPLRRFGTGDEVAQAALFLAGPGAAYVTGIELPVDGGLGIA
ncbi:MAG: SDR family oxidoreductase [Nannocystis sp.]|nr:SDR family oxidoreductase [Nannocystis sp.]